MAKLPRPKNDDEPDEDLVDESAIDVDNLPDTDDVTPDEEDEDDD